MLAKYRPGKGCGWSGILREWLINGMGWAYAVRQTRFCDPVRVEIGIDAGDGREETFEQFLFAQAEIFVVGFEVITAVDDMVSAKIFRREEIGMLDQRQEWITGRLGQIEPVIAFVGKLVLQRQDHYYSTHAL